MNSPEELLKPSSFNCGDKVLARCEEAGCPPVCEGVVSAVMWNRKAKHYEYEITERGNLVSDGYTDSWLTLISHPTPTPHKWTADELWNLFWENKKPMMQTTVDWKLFEVLADAINAKNQSNERKDRHHHTIREIP